MLPLNCPWNSSISVSQPVGRRGHCASSLCHGANGTPLPPPATRAVYFPTAGGFVECPVYDYATLPSGASITGPAIITQDLSTIVVQPQHQVHLDSYGNIIMTIPQHT